MLIKKDLVYYYLHTSLVNVEPAKQQRVPKIEQLAHTNGIKRGITLTANIAI